MGLVDKWDMQLSFKYTGENLPYSIKNFSFMCWTFAFSIPILYKLKTEKNIPLIKFALNVIRQIIEKHLQPKPSSSDRRRVRNTSGPLWLVGKSIPGTSKRAKGLWGCHVCKCTIKNLRQETLHHIYVKNVTCHFVYIRVLNIIHKGFSDSFQYFFLNVLFSYFACYQYTWT